jgi:hypothetical protein
MLSRKFLTVFPIFLVACGHEGVSGQTPAQTGELNRVAVNSSSNSLLAPVLTPPDGVTYGAVMDLDQKGDQAVPQLRKGWIANSPDWPASLYATFETPQGTGACTAALIGPQVMLTAAHCVPANGLVSFSYARKRFDTTCTRHPQYANDQDDSADFALCKLASPFLQPSSSFLYETVDIEPMANLLNQQILLTGYGCRSDEAAESDADGRYRYGFNTVSDTSASASKSRGTRYYSPTEDNNLFTDIKGANICPGDSGGPAFLRTKPQGTSILSRVIVGVNSRVFYADASRRKYGSSLVSSTGTREFRDWAKQWMIDNHVQACGIVTPSNIPNCRL